MIALQLLSPTAPQKVVGFATYKTSPWSEELWINNHSPRSSLINHCFSRFHFLCHTFCRRPFVAEEDRFDCSDDKAPNQQVLRSESVDEWTRQHGTYRPYKPLWQDGVTSGSLLGFPRWCLIARRRTVGQVLVLHFVLRPTGGFSGGRTTGTLMNGQASRRSAGEVWPTTGGKCIFRHCCVFWAQS